MGCKGISRFGTDKPNHVSILEYLAQMFYPAGQTEILPRWHLCVHSLCMGLWGKRWWIASTNTSCMSGNKIMADGKKFLWKVPFKHTQWPWSRDHAGGTLLPGGVSPLLRHPHKGQPEHPSSDPISLPTLSCSRATVGCSAHFSPSTEGISPWLPDHMEQNIPR